MKNKKYPRCCILSLAAVAAASAYPLYMGIRVLRDILNDGTVMKENYPKYIIPYTPIALAVILGTLLMPLFIRLFRRYALIAGGALSLGAFFGFELLFENKIVVTAAETVVKLEDWQMFMCYQPPGGWETTVTEYKTKTAAEILMGDYNPAFKLHFYVISVVLVLSLLNCVYGFAQMLKTGDKSRIRPLALQALSAGSFLGLCILACFTAFWRDGNIRVSPLSAALMCVFFVLLGVTVGLFIGSFFTKKKKALSLLVPAASASATTLLMYAGEMILLHGHLYLLGDGFVFNSIPGIVLAPADILVVIVSGAITCLLMLAVTGKSRK
jgi:hypothetical protein